MSYSVIKSLVVDFNDLVDLSQLQDEITANTTITTACDRINISEDDVIIVFLSALSITELAELDVVVSKHTPSLSTHKDIYDAVCNPDGTADYLKPSEAFAAGHVSVFMQNGVYFETNDIVLPNYGSLIAESGPNTIIHFSGTPSSIVVDGSDGVQEDTGTISLTTGTSAVTGSGTKFTNITVTSPSSVYILLGTNYFKVASVESDTELTIKDTYRGATLTDESFVLQKMFTGNQLSNFIITGSSSVGIHVRGCRHFVIDSLAFRVNFPNVLVEYSGDSSLKHILSESGYGVGMIVNNCASLALDICDVYNNTSHGIEIKGTSISIVLNGCESSNNGGTGVYVTGVANEINLTDCVIKHNNIHGLHCDTNTMSAMIDSSAILGNTDSGMNISGYSHVIAGNIIEDSGGIGIDVIADECTLNANNVKYNTDGIKFTGSQGIATGNHACHNSAIGINIIGDDIVVSNNICSSNTGTGIKVDLDATDTIVSYNNCKNNIGINLEDNGTASETIGNKV